MACRNTGRRSKAPEGVACRESGFTNPAGKSRRKFPLSLGSGACRGATPVAIALCRSRLLFRYADGRQWPRHCIDPRRRGSHAAAAPHEGGGGVADCARRYRRRLAGDAGGARLDRPCRYRGGQRGSLYSGRCRARRAAQAERQGAAADRQRLYRAGDGQNGCVRVELLERYRSHCFVRSRRAGLAEGRGAFGAVRQNDAAAGQASPVSDRGRLRVPHRPAPAARSGLHGNCDFDRGGDVVLRKHGPELGARHDDQGARLCRRYHSGRGDPARTVPLRLAPLSRFRVGRRRARDEAADQCVSRPWRDRRRRSQHQARPRRHPRG